MRLTPFSSLKASDERFPPVGGREIDTWCRGGRWAEDGWNTSPNLARQQVLDVLAAHDEPVGLMVVLHQLFRDSVDLNRKLPSRRNDDGASACPGQMAV